MSDPENTKEQALAGAEAKPASSEEAARSAEPASATGTSLPAAGVPSQANNRSLIYWIAVVVVLLGVELYYYGSKGDVKVCVGKEGAHDFRLIGQERTDENRWKFPFCEDRVNLGLRSHFDELGRDAVKVACRRATLMHFKDEQGACNAGDKNWKRKVITKQILPWDRRFYRRLFWLDR